jgi:integrase/recombinase XerD
MIDSFFAENPVSPATRELYARALTKFLSFCCEPSTCTPGDILKFLDSTGWGSSLRYTAVTAIKKYLRWKFGAEHPALRVRVKRDPAKPGRVLNKVRAETLLASFDLATIKGKRDYAIACLALDTGLRVKELASLRFADVDLGERRLKVRIKGGRWEDAVFSAHTRAAIADWCNYRRMGDDRLFQVTRDGLRVIVRRWGEKLGFRLSPHDLRRSFATLSTKNGAPSRLVQVAGRWSSIEMVEHYTQSLEPSDFDEFFPISHMVK